MIENEVLSGFSALFEEIRPNAPQGREIKGMEIVADPNEHGFDTTDQYKDEEEVVEDEELELEPEASQEPEEEVEEESTEPEEEVEIPEEEVQQVSALFDAIAEQVGWTGISDDEKPKSIESLVEYMKESIEASTTPGYANETIQALDAYVRNGGDMNDFLELKSNGINYDSLDLDNEDTQKAVLSEFLKEKGFSETQIRRKIEKYEDAGLLRDEAEDSVEFLKEIAVEREKELLEEQEKLSAEAQVAQQNFYNNVVSQIEALTDVRGIKIPEKDKRELRDYIFKVEHDGKTRYQKEYAMSTKNLIESAYFTWKGDSLMESAKRSGETSAVERLRKTLNSTKIGGSKQKINTGAPAPLWSLASQQLIGRRK